jgi:hypothetical protein
VKIILTGATGFLGAEVLRQALDDATVDQVLVLTRRPVGVAREIEGSNSSRLSRLFGPGFQRLRRLRLVPGGMSTPNRKRLAGPLRRMLFWSVFSVAARHKSGRILEQELNIEISQTFFGDTDSAIRGRGSDRRCCRRGAFGSSGYEQ